jgi:hypothetical protein
MLRPLSSTWVQRMRVLAVGDSYMPSRLFAGAFAALEREHEVPLRGSGRSGRVRPVHSRDIFQSRAPAAMLAAVSKVVHEDARPDEAFDLFTDLSREVALA